MLREDIPQKISMFVQ